MDIFVKELRIKLIDFYSFEIIGDILINSYFLNDLIRS